MNQYFGIDKHVFAVFCLSIGFLGFGIFLWFSIDSAIDYDILNNQIKTNQTFVDTLDCEKIQLGINHLNFVLSPTQQDEVNELKENFKKLSREKRCDV